MREEWLLRGAAVPVTCETVAELVAEIKRLINVIGGMALAQPEHWTPEDAAYRPGGMAQPDHIVNTDKMVAEQEPDWGAAQVHRWGLTMRDYFAAKAMKTYSDDTDELLLENAIRAYKQADAMIKARQA